MMNIAPPGDDLGLELGDLRRDGRGEGVLGVENGGGEGEQEE
jgi:hypothetical protein